MKIQIIIGKILLAVHTLSTAVFNYYYFGFKFTTAYN